MQGSFYRAAPLFGYFGPLFRYFGLAGSDFATLARTLISLLWLLVAQGATPTYFTTLAFWDDLFHYFGFLGCGSPRGLVSHARYQCLRGLCPRACCACTFDCLRNKK